MWTRCRLTGAHIRLCWFLCKHKHTDRRHRSHLGFSCTVGVCMSVCAPTLTVSSVLCMYLDVCDAGVSVQLAVVSVGFAVAATNPVLCVITPLQRETRVSVSLSPAGWFKTTLQGPARGQTSLNNKPLLVFLLDSLLSLTTYMFLCQILKYSVLSPSCSESENEK